jgi:diguanylate cyclase (GGDEF)-like protein
VSSSIRTDEGRGDGRSASVLDLLPCAVVIADPDAGATSVNRAWRDLTAQSERESHGDGWLDVCGTGDRDARRSALLADARRGVAHRADWVVSGRNNDRRTIHVDARPAFHGGQLQRIVITVTDVTDDRARIARLLDRATHDAVTGLCNRAQFLEFLAHALDRRRRAPERIAAVLFVDVDDLKATNDAFGHDAGDEVLRRVAERIKAGVRPADVVGRYGGDEFTVLCEDLRDANEASAIADRIRDSMAADPRQEVSIGIAIADEPDIEPATIVAAADRAMYRAKRRRVDRPCAVGPHTLSRATGDLPPARVDGGGGRRHDVDVLAVAAHELRTPLTTIASCTSTLRAHRDRLTPAELDAAFGFLERQTQRLSDTLDQLLDLGRYRHDWPDSEAVHLAGVVADALEVAPPPAEVTVRLAGDLTTDASVVAAERSTVTRVLVNLLTNAYRYGGPTITIDAHGEAGRVALGVQDDGPGITDRLEVAMFAPFVRGDRDGAGPRGAGLGLAVARQIAESFGGRLVHQAVRPHGARFTLWLPVSTSPEAAAVDRDARDDPDPSMV